MLTYLAEHSTLPVPGVRQVRRDLLVMDYIDAPNRLDATAEWHGAELVAALHSVAGESFGLERDTVIGGLHQPNGRASDWLAFFRDRRLLYMAGQAREAGRLPPVLMSRLDAFAGQLDRFIDASVEPVLLHGDLWTGNVLVNRGRVVGFIDPAIYYGDAEMDLAFSTLFGTFNRPFFDRYNEIRPIKPGFFGTRRDIYNLYPLLVHARLFGGTYAASVDAILTRLGF
jgi:fructosamine-3-kinase